MTRKPTRRAIEWPRMIFGLSLSALGVLYFTYVDTDSNLSPALFFCGLALSGTACLGRGCNLCGKVLKYREFGFAPERAHEVTNIVASQDIDRVIALLAGPRRGDLDNPRTALMISSCPRCQQLAELTVGGLGPGFQTYTEQLYQGPDVARLHAAVRTTRKQ